MTQTKADPYSVICPQCKAPVGMNCTYVHPREWTRDSQQRFFNRKSREEQIEIIQRAGDYTKQPHLSRFTEARKKINEEQLAHQPPLSWDYIQPAPGQFVNKIQFGDQNYYPQTYIDNLLAEARAEWEADRASANHRDNLGSYKRGIEVGKKRAIDLIATGIVEGY